METNKLLFSTSSTVNYGQEFCSGSKYMQGCTFIHTVTQLKHFSNGDSCNFMSQVNFVFGAPVTLCDLRAGVCYQL